MSDGVRTHDPLTIVLHHHKPNEASYVKRFVMDSWVRTREILIYPVKIPFTNHYYHRSVVLPQL